MNHPIKTKIGRKPFTGSAFLRNAAAGLLFAACLASLPRLAFAGTINVDCQNNAGAVATQGVLPAGAFWNQLDNNDTTFPVRSDANVVLPNTGVASGGGGTSVDPGANPIQADSISNLGGQVSVSIFGLRPDSYYKLVVYNARDAGGGSTVQVAAGPSKSTGTSTNPASVAAMIEGRDYVVFPSVFSGAGGAAGFFINHPTLTQLGGFQLQGWLEGEPFPYETDLQISRKKSGGYKGVNKTSGNQSQTISGKRAAKFYFRLRNNADICGTYGVRGKANDKKARRKWFDLTDGRKNVTATVKQGKFQAGIGDGEFATLMAKVRKKSDRKAVTVLRGFPCDDPSQATDKCKAILK